MGKAGGLKGNEGMATLEPISKSIFEEADLSQQSHTYRERSNGAENARVDLSMSCACAHLALRFSILR